MGVRRLKLFCKFEMFNQANWYNQSNKCTMNGYFIRCKKSFLPELGRHLTFFLGGWSWRRQADYQHQTAVSMGLDFMKELMKRTKEIWYKQSF